MRPRDPYVSPAKPTDRSANIHRWPRRTTANREMVSGMVSWCLYLAIKDRCQEKNVRQYKLIAEMDLGASTIDRMRNCKPIAQTTALKIVTFLGTSVRAVLSKYQQEKK